MVMFLVHIGPIELHFFSIPTGGLPNAYLTPKEQITATTALISSQHDIKHRVCHTSYTYTLCKCKTSANNICKKPHTFKGATERSHFFLFHVKKKNFLKVFNRKYLYWLIFAYCLRGKITPCYTNALITLLASTTYLSLLCNPKINLLLVCRNPLISPHPSLAINNNTYLLSGSQRTCKHTKTHYEYSSFL